MSYPSEHPTAHRLRLLALALAALASFVTLLELVFSEHYTEILMLVPFALTALTLFAIILVAFWPSTRLLRLFQGAMAPLFVGSALGVFFHLRGNLEIAQEVSPDLGGLGVAWKVLTGAAPALAPGLLAFVGLLGLIYTYRHPGLAGGRAPAFEGAPQA